jgi:hypothetical protein
LKNLNRFQKPIFLNNKVEDEEEEKKTNNIIEI